METFHSIIKVIDDFIWGWPLIILLFGTHIFMTFRTGFVQKNIFSAIKLSFKKDSSAQGDVSQFQALATALSSTIGTGNIIGVGTAISVGGPGAVLWMWLSGVFGMATKYSETLIGVKYRVKSKDGSMIGGAMYALERGLKAKWLGIIFAILAAICAFGIGCTVQANAVVGTLTENIDLSGSTSSFGIFINEHLQIILAVVLTLLVGITIIGGIKSISRVSEILVPFMAIFYVIGCIVILVINRDVLGETFATIFDAAFNVRAAAGGFVGSTVLMACRYGFARGLFSNESGMGSAPLVASAARTANPKRQALVSMTGTFWDTVIICLITGLVLVSCIIKYDGIDSLSGDGGILTSQAFSMIPYVGLPILLIGLVCFAFSTILGWYYYGERCAVYLFGERVILLYKIVWVIVLFLGGIMELNLVWDLADMLNGFMAIPNIIAVLLLSTVIAKETKKYKGAHIDDIDTTEIPVMDNAKSGVLSFKKK